MSDLEALVDRYLALWQDPDPQARRAAIAEVFSEDIAHFTETREVHGLEEMADRVTDSYRAWVEPGKYVFRSAKNATGHHGAVRFNWEMVPIGGGDVAAVGFDFVLLNEEGRICLDYQFVDSQPPTP